MLASWDYKERVEVLCLEGWLNAECSKAVLEIQVEPEGEEWLQMPFPDARVQWGSQAT